MINIAELRSKLNGGLPFMDGKEKADIIKGNTYNIVNYGFLKSEDGEFICFLDKDDDKHFFFGGQVLTTKIQELEQMVSTDEMIIILKNGLEVKFGEKKSANGFKYTTCEFFPSHKE